MKRFASCAFVLFACLMLSGCFTDWSRVGLPRGYNGHIMYIIPGKTPFAYVTSMYGSPYKEDIQPDGSKNSTWLIDTSEGPCMVIIGFTEKGIVNWYNYTYERAIKRR